MSLDPQNEIDFERTAWCPDCRCRFEMLFTGNTESAYAHASCPECQRVITAEREMPHRNGGGRRIRETARRQASTRAENERLLRELAL